MWWMFLKNDQNHLNLLTYPLFQKREVKTTVGRNDIDNQFTLLFQIEK